MNNIFKKTLSLVACAVLVGQTMMTSVAYASEKMANSQLNSEVSNSRVNSTPISKEISKSVDNVKIVSHSESTSSNGGGKVTEVSSEWTVSSDTDVCDARITKDAMNILKEAVDEELSSKNITGIRTSIEDNKLVLILSEGKTISDLTPYKDSLINLMLGYDGVSIWSKLSQQWFELDISTVNQLININLGLNKQKIFDLNVFFNDCRLKFQLEFRTNSISTKICDKGTTITALNILKDVANEEISSKNITGIRATVEGNKLVLVLNNGNSFPDLTPYKDSLYDFLLGNGTDSVWSELAEEGFIFTSSNVTQLYNIILRQNDQKIFDMNVLYNDCLAQFQLEFRTSNTSIQICDSDTTNSALNIIKNAVNEEIVNKNATGIRATIENSKLILFLGSGKDIPDLTTYVQPLYDVILGYDTVSMWSKLAEKGFLFNASNVTQLYNIILRTGDQKVFNMGVLYGDCLVQFQLEFKTDTSNQICDNSTTNNAMTILKSAVDEELANNKITGIKTSIENDVLVLTFDKWKEVHDLTPYINSLINQILWIESDSIWSKLAREGFFFDVSDVNQLININLGLGSQNSFDLSAKFTDCILKFKLELRVDNSGGNGWSSSGWGGYSGGGGSSSRWWSSSSSRWNNDDEDLSFWGEVSDLERACSIEGSTYSDEINEAYMWACKKWIVAADNIMKANLKNPITRAELDKMLSIYAIKLLGMKHVTEKSVTYPDVSNKLGDLAFYIQEWYKLQIMWIHADGTPLSRFSPNSLVTRWEFWTVFSRILYGNEYNIESSSYYTKHLDLLKNAGILTNTNPKIMEKRSRILLMLYRSQNVKKSNWSISLEDIAAIVAGK